MCFPFILIGILFIHFVICISSPINCLIFIGFLNLFLFSLGTKLSCMTHLFALVSIITLVEIDSFLNNNSTSTFISLLPTLFISIVLSFYYLSNKYYKKNFPLFVSLYPSSNFLL